MSPRDVLKVFVFHQKDADKTDEDFEKHVGEVMVGYEKVLIDNKEIVDGTIEK
ncbi:hypothetical protein COL26b_005904 [Colletotrichum chrysophilum]|uniref:uncharacterized protein n=1 Tax=Colletotrichum chrysophilum TaxID=1836956 RepID=UPI0022FFDD5A|nr:uncharacterized protein COL26b_005904 [Colletotrichum chrysophilum]KAJ0375929.1 hypothetical protein COL26b_005904 [Colletotrichum chrysophilum]